MRAELPSEVAGYGDVYTVLYQREGKWFLVQYPNHTFNAIAWPHTEEDAISAIGFFTDQNESFEYPGAFYLLSVYKAFEKSVPKAGVITFELYKLQKNADFDFIEFHEIGTLKTGKKYSNVDCAIESELGLSSLNGNDVNSACTKR